MNSFRRWADLGVEDVAGFLERRECVAVHHFRPQVAVIAGRIAAHDVHEVRQAVAHDDFRRHADAVERFAFEAVDVDRRLVGFRIERHVDERRRGVLDGGEALVEVARGVQPLAQLRRHRLAALVVDRIRVEDFLGRKPVLEKLRRQFDEIARHRRARNRRIGHVREQPVQPVAELMKQRARIVERQQRRFAVAALGEIHDVDDDRALALARCRADGGNATSRRPTAWRSARSSRRGTRRRGGPSCLSPPKRAPQGDSADISRFCLNSRPKRRRAQSKAASIILSSCR